MVWETVVQRKKLPVLLDLAGQRETSRGQLDRIRLRSLAKGTIEGPTEGNQVTHPGQVGVVGVIHDVAKDQQGPAGMSDKVDLLEVVLLL